MQLFKFPEILDLDYIIKTRGHAILGIMEGEGLFYFFIYKIKPNSIFDSLKGNLVMGELLVFRQISTLINENTFIFILFRMRRKSIMTQAYTI